MPKKLLVEDYKVKFITSEDGRFLENIILDLTLEDGERFIMGGIPLEIATEIKKYLSKNDSSHNSKLIINSDDSRYTIFDILIDIPNIEKVLYNSIREVVIDYYDPEYNIYGATIELERNYTIARKKILMIPSHAILLSLLANKKVYVSRKLVVEQKYIADDSRDFPDSSDDEWSDDEDYF